jgi:predicted amidohydrolase YtcJ
MQRFGARAALASGLLLVLVRQLTTAEGGTGVAPAAAAPADAVYLNGRLYTVDAQESLQEALAVRNGRITYVGGTSGARALVGANTRVIDLEQRLLMPGLVDGHMHPLEAGTALLKCNLNYERLTVAQLQARVQACLDETASAAPDKWLEVVNWFREAMLPNGVATTRATLDALETRRPIFIMSSFGHTALVNTRALQLANISAKTPDPLGGRIDRDSSGAPSGILEDAAFEKVSAVIPKATPAEDREAAGAALAAMRRQGVTSFLDAMATPRTLAAFAAVQKQGGLTARAHFAVLITPEQGRDPRQAVITARALAHRYDQGATRARPGITVRNIKLFMDGVITAPACTGAMLSPYFTNAGTAAAPQWAPGSNRGPEVYFPAAVLHPLLIAAARAGLEPHMHADGDRAVHEALDGVAALRQVFPGSAIRAAIAHDEIVDPADFVRFRQLDAIPVLSFQWEKPAPDTIDGAQDYLGPERFRYLEPAGYLASAGARIAYGSDWPIDPLNEWFALKVAITRENDPAVGAKYAGRLSSDAGLTLPAAIRAITANSAYELHAERDVGSLEVGKLADFIVLDRDVFEIPPPQVAAVQVLLTVVGGKAVYAAAPFAVTAAPPRAR